MAGTVVPSACTITPWARRAGVRGVGVSERVVSIFPRSGV